MTWEDHGGELALAVGLYLMIRCAEAVVPKAVRARRNARIARRPTARKSSAADQERPKGGTLVIGRP